MYTSTYGVWPEAVWHSRDICLGPGKRLTAGIDIGTTSAEAAVMCDGGLFAYSVIRVGANFHSAAERALSRALEGTGVEPGDIASICATGFGRENAAIASKKADEVRCHAIGARALFGPEVKTVVDMGGQTIKAIRLFDWDRVRDIAMNDKCATGQGRSLEALCELLHIGIEELGPRSLEAERDPEPVSTTCYAFANTETMGLFGRPEFKSGKLSEAEIYASHLFAYAWRILGVIGKLSPLDVGGIRVDGRLALTGGLAKNPGITRRIERELGVECAKSEHDPMIAGAVGAAILA